MTEHPKQLRLDGTGKDTAKHPKQRLRTGTNAPVCIMKRKEDEKMAMPKKEKAPGEQKGEPRYRFSHDLLFKMLFVKHVGLLKKLVAALLEIGHAEIGQFAVLNPEMPPESVGSKFSRFDIRMTANGKAVILEIQVLDEGNFRERAVFYAAKEIARSLKAGDNYAALPQVVSVNIVGFRMFGCPEYSSEFRLLETGRREELTDKIRISFYELDKLPDEPDKGSAKELWLKLFQAKTKSDLKKIRETGVPEMSEAIAAYESVTLSPEFREIALMREKAMRDEANALSVAAKRGKIEGKIETLFQELELSIDAIAKKLGMAEEYVTEVLAKLGLPDKGGAGVKPLIREMWYNQ